MIRGNPRRAHSLAPVSPWSSRLMTRKSHTLPGREGPSCRVPAYKWWQLFGQRALMSGTSDRRNFFHVKENGFVLDFFLAPPQPGHLSAMSHCQLVRPSQTVYRYAYVQNHLRCCSMNTSP